MGTVWGAEKKQRKNSMLRCLNVGRKMHSSPARTCEFVAINVVGAPQAEATVGLPADTRHDTLECFSTIDITLMAFGFAQYHGTYRLGYLLVTCASPQKVEQ